MKAMISGKVVSIFFLVYFRLALPVFCQPPGNPGGDEDAPIAGIAWLLAAGGLFGARKIYHNITRKR